MTESAAIWLRPATRGPETASMQMGRGAGFALSLAAHLALVAWLAWGTDGTPGRPQPREHVMAVDVVPLPMPPEPVSEPDPEPAPKPAEPPSPPASTAKPPARPAAKTRPVRAAEPLPRQEETAAIPAPFAEAAPPPAQAAPAPAPPPSGGKAAADDEFRRYAEKIWAEIAARRPPRVRKKGLAMLEFTVSRQGAVEAARIAASSGDPDLDRFALEALAEAAPFPPPPQSAATAQLTFRLPFAFR